MYEPRIKPITCGRTAGATAADPATSTCTIRATCFRATVPVATAGRSPVEKNLTAAFTLTPPPLLLLLMSSRATAAIPVGPDDDIENDADRLDNVRPLPPPPPPREPPLLLPSVVSVAGRGIEEAEAASEGANAGGERRYKSGAKAPDSLNARRHTCFGFLLTRLMRRQERRVWGRKPESEHGQRRCRV